MLASFPKLGFILAVAIGGAIGSVLRFIVSHYTTAYFGMSFPWGTLAVNLFGSLWLGFFGALIVSKPDAIDPNFRFLITAGFAGGLTTFSSLAFETLAIYERGDTAIALANVAANLILGMILVWLGASLARTL